MDHFSGGRPAERVRHHGIAVTHDFAASDWKGRAIPLPATFTILLGEQMQAQNAGLQVRLFSAYPFPWRSERVLDSFQKKALGELQNDSGRPYMEFTELDGAPVLRYAVADVMRA